MKSLARKASLTEGSARATKAYKAKVASLTSERADLQARIQSLTEDVVKHKSDLRHTSTAKAQAEDKERKAREGLRVAKGELRVAREELQAARDELRNKTVLLDQACREASEAKSSIERLTEECITLRGDLKRQEASVNQRDGVIVELRDQACTLWASGWLAFQRSTVKAFPGLDLNFQVPDEEEVEESLSDGEADPRVSSDASNPAHGSGEPAKASSPSLPVGTLPSVQSSVSDV